MKNKIKKFTWTTPRYDSIAIRQILEDDIRPSSTVPSPVKPTKSNALIFSTIEIYEWFLLAI